MDSEDTMNDYTFHMLRLLSYEYRYDIRFAYSFVDEDEFVGDKNLKESFEVTSSPTHFFCKPDEHATLCYESHLNTTSYQNLKEFIDYKYLYHPY